MSMQVLTNRHLKLAFNLPQPFKHLFSRLFSTSVVPSGTLFHSIPTCLWLLCLLLGGSFLPLYAQSDKFEGGVSSPPGTSPETSSLIIETSGLTSGKNVTITVAGEGIEGSASPYTVKLVRA